MKALAGGTALVVVGCASARDRSSHCQNVPHIVMGVDQSGRPTSEWIEAIRNRIDAEALAEIARTQKPLSADEAEWHQEVQSAMAPWCGRIARLNAPFRHVTPPRSPYVLVGNQGGGDGFTTGRDGVALDLGEMARGYAQVPSDARPALLQRLLAHEYTHLLLHRQLDANGWTGDSVVGAPFREALRTLYNEGIANFRSVESDQWIAPDGGLTERARATLTALQPVMIERLSALARNPPAEEARNLLANISQGPLTRKWGAMPVALWLADDTRGGDDRLAYWIERNPGGILELGVERGEEAFKPMFRDLLAQARNLAPT